MDFIERYFGISPDAGDSSLEIMLAVLLLMIMIAIWMHLPATKKAQADLRKKRRY